MGAQILQKCSKHLQILIWTKFNFGRKNRETYLKTQNNI
jgi:hypothetical protein